jgi:hypothetical protein
VTLGLPFGPHPCNPFALVASPKLGLRHRRTPNPHFFQVLGFTPTLGQSRVATPDALSRKHQLRVVYVGETKPQKEVRLISRHDAFAKEVRQNIQNGTKSHFHLRNGLLWYKQNRLYVPEGKIRDTLL